MEHECQICNRGFDSKEALNQHNQAKHLQPVQVKKINIRKYIIISLILLIIIFFGGTIYSQTKKPGSYDEFAQCLTEKGVKVYGNDFCQYTTKQFNYFGKSKQYLNYIKCSENKELCDSKDITTTPTWEINNELYSQVQTFERLEAITGCKI
ncbi:MAG: hypothetical protein AABW90_00400 [Nanoarchaeota archaeon]